MDRRSMLVGVATLLTGCSIRGVEGQAAMSTEESNRTRTSSPTPTPTPTSTPEPTTASRYEPDVARYRIGTARQQLRAATSAFETAFNRTEYGSESPQFDGSAVTAAVEEARNSLDAAAEVAAPEQGSTLDAVASYAELLERMVDVTNALVASLAARPGLMTYRNSFDEATADLAEARSTLDEAKSRLELTRVEYRTARRRLETPDSVGLPTTAEMIDQFDAIVADLGALYEADIEVKEGWDDYRTGREDYSNLAASAFDRAKSHFGRAAYMYNRRASPVPGWISELDRTIELVGDGSATGEYTITVDGKLRGTSIDSEDSVDGTTATGTVQGRSDKYAFSGSITDVEVPEGVTIYVDGQEASPELFGSDSPSELTNTIVIAGTGQRADYELTVSGAIEKNGAKGSINDGDVIDGTTAKGFVGGGDDAYDYAGLITDFTLSGDAGVVINGEEIDPSTLAPGPSTGPDIAFDRMFNTHECQCRRFRTAAEKKQKAALVGGESPDKADQYRDEAVELLSDSVAECS